MNGNERSEDYKNVVKTKDKKNSIPGNDAKKCCCTDCSGHRDNGSDWGLSPLSPTSLFKLSPCRLREVDPIRNER